MYYPNDILNNVPRGGQVYYDPTIGSYYRQPVSVFQKNEPGVMSTYSPSGYNQLGQFSAGRTGYYRRVPIGDGFGQTAYTPPTVDFNNLPSQIPTGVQVYGGGTQATSYQRPTAPTQPQGTGYRPQFDPTFIQQMLAQRFGNNQGSGIPTATRPAGPPTLTPGTRNYYPSNPPMQSGLGALQAIGNTTSPAPAAGGTTNAPV